MSTDMSALPPTMSSHMRAMVQAAFEAGTGLLAASAQRRTLITTEKTRGDFVSEADLEAEQVIKTRLDAIYPDYGWLGEEGDARAARNTHMRWIVDPLDGTTNFLKGLPHWAVSIALCDGDEVMCAVIHDPIKGETFTAERGQGAYLNGARIRVSSGVAMQSALFATGVPAGGRITYLPNCLQDLEALMPHTAGVRRWGAASLDLAYVAAGRIEGYWERNLGPWDIAAGILLVREAGGHVAPLWDGQGLLSSGSFIACNADLSADLTGMINKVR